MSVFGANKSVAELQKYDMPRLNNYPFVVFHGFAGYGEDEFLNKVAPYFGWFSSTRIKDLYAEFGTELYVPSLSGVSSMWDRCCEMYAHIVGGTVDYGKAHSEKYGHKRFGRTYEALVPDWGQLDAEGKIKKINVIGHSYGGPTVRYFVHLMTVGDAEERAATPASELSGLFEGGHAGWIHSCTTLAGANDGISFLYAIEDPAPKIARLVLEALSLMGNFKIVNKVYDSMLDEWGITMNTQTGEKRDKNYKQRIEDYLLSDGDCVLDDLTIHKFRKKSADWTCQDNIYYFAYYASKSAPNAAGKYRPRKGMIPLMIPFSYIVGAYEGCAEDADHAAIGPEWKENDGLVNVMSGRAPRTKPWTPYVDDRDLKPGIWYDMPIEDKDHMSYMGSGESKADYALFFYDILRRIDNLPSID